MKISAHSENGLNYKCMEFKINFHEFLFGFEYNKVNDIIISSTPILSPKSGTYIPLLNQLFCADIVNTISKVMIPRWANTKDFPLLDPL